MRQIVLFVSVLVLFLVCIVNGAEPNFVRTTLVSVGRNDYGLPTNVTSTDYSNGLGRAIQSKLQLNNGRARVVSSFFDDAGRPYLSTKPYIDKVANLIALFTPGDFNEINSTLNNSDNYDDFLVGGLAYAYSEMAYYDDPLGRVKRAGAPGYDYRLGSDQFTSSWTFGVVKNYTTPIHLTVSNVYITIGDGFIKAFSNVSASDASRIPLTHTILDEFYEYLLLHPLANADYFLSVARDPDGKISQELKDLFGRTNSTRAGTYDNPIIAEYDFDILGNVLLEHAPKNGSTTLISDSKYQYNTLGQLVRKESPDLFVEEMTYDNAGNVESKIVHGMNGTYDDFIITYNYDYDDMSRLRRISTPHATNSGAVALIKYYYDNTDEFFTAAKVHSIPTEHFTNLENTQGKLVAEIAYNRPGGRHFYFAGQNVACVVDVYSYDDEGRIKTKFKVIPGLPLQTINYTYDNHGKMVTEEFSCGSTTSTKYYKYNADGNLKAIAHGSSGDDIVTYTYDTHGWLESKDFSKLTGDKTLSYTYNVRDWLESTSFNGANSFSQAIDYINDNPGGSNTTPQTFNGNIRHSTVTYAPSAGATVVFEQSYVYDAVNKLVEFNTKNRSGFDDPNHSGSFGYDNAGRFTSKVEGSSNNNAYDYYPIATDPNLNKTCRLIRAKTGGGIYIYDYKGNMIIDQSKNMYISYDWRNLPIKFDFYGSLPVGPTDASKISPDPYGTMIITDNSYLSDDPTNYVDYIDWLRANGAIKLLSSVQMYYDAAGKRVLKVEN